MAVKTETTVINDIQYNVTQLFAEDAIKVECEIANLIGGDFVRLFTDSGKLADLLKNIDPEKTLALFKKLIQNKCVTKKINVDGSDIFLPVSINEDFSGDLVGLHSLLFFIIEVNFKSFFLGAIPHIAGFVNLLTAVKS